MSNSQGSHTDGGRGIAKTSRRLLVAAGRIVLVMATGGLMLATVGAPRVASAQSARPLASAPPTWTQLSSPSVRSNTSTAYDASTGQFILFGGYGCDYCSSFPYDNDTWSWNGSSWIELYPPTRPSVRGYASMAYDASTGQLVLFGGGNGMTAALSDTWTWNGSTWTEQAPATSPPGRSEASMAYDPALGEIVLFGGYGDDELLSDTWAWNGVTWSRLSPATTPPARQDASMAFDPTTQQLVLAGGLGQASAYLSDTWTFDGSQWTQGCLGGPICVGPVTGASMAYDDTTGQLLLVGGITYEVNGGFMSGGTWAWDGSSWGALDAPAYSSGLARRDASMAYDAGTGQLVLFGGVSASGTLLNDTWTWDGATWSDMSVFATPTARFGDTIAYDSRTSQVVLFGGQAVPGGSESEADGFAADTWTFDGTTWAHAATGPPGRYDASMAYDPATNQVVLFGGVGVSGELDDTWTFDGSSWTQQLPATSPSARAGASMAYDAATGQLILFGGLSDSSGADGDTWVWTGSTWSQLSPGSSPAARAWASMAYDPATSQLVLFGGTPDVADDTLADTWTWDGSNWMQQCTAGCNSVPARAQASLAYEGATSQLLLFGGISQQTGSYLGDIWTWDGSNWTEQSVASAPPGRADAPMTYDAATDQIVLFGGDGPAGCQDSRSCGALGDTWTFDGTTWSQVAPTSETPATSDAAMAYDSGTGQLVYLADDNDAGSVNSTWTFDGTTWTDHPRLPTPPALQDTTMAYDPSSGQLILFGGISNGYLNDTWDWNGASWTELSPAVSPTPRARESMTYDAALGEIVLFGGFGQQSDNSLGTLNDTWAWNGSTWAELSPAASPPARDFASMAYDADTGQVLLFGGTDGTDLGDTWTFDGSTWTEQTPAASPPARFDASMAYDSGLGELVLFGGSGLSGPTATILDDTWSWDGSSWSELSPANSPPARDGASMAYDAGMDQLVLLGGSNGVNDLSDFWAFAPSAAAPAVSLSVGEAPLGTPADVPAAGSVGVTYGGENTAVFTVTVTGTSGRPAPTGKVVVEDAVASFPTRICTVTTFAISGVRATGTCRARAKAFPAGTNFLLAVTGAYSGNSSYDSESAQLARTFRVGKAKSTTALELSSSSLVHGQEQAEKFSVAVTPQYSGVPHGRVAVRVGKKVLCMITLSHRSGTCSPLKAALPVGTYSVTASYSGRENFAGSNSRAAKLAVTAGPSRRSI